MTIITVAQVLTGPLQSGDDALAHRYRKLQRGCGAVPQITKPAPVAELADQMASMRLQRVAADHNTRVCSTIW